jgi:hypothetical protein
MDAVLHVLARALKPTAYNDHCGRQENTCSLQGSMQRS